MRFIRGICVCVIAIALVSSKALAQSLPPRDAKAPSSSSSLVQQSVKKADHSRRWMWAGIGLLAGGATLEAIGHHGERGSNEHNGYNLAGASLAGASFVILLTKGRAWKDSQGAAPIRSRDWTIRKMPTDIALGDQLFRKRER